jgi:hypothetical protein
MYTYLSISSLSPKSLENNTEEILKCAKSEKTRGQQTDGNRIVEGGKRWVRQSIYKAEGVQARGLLRGYNPSADPAGLSL